MSCSSLKSDYIYKIVSQSWLINPLMVPCSSDADLWSIIAHILIVGLKSELSFKFVLRHHFIIESGTGKMAHDYSVEIHDYITEKITMITEEQKKLNREPDNHSRQFLQGQLDELMWLREYLSRKIDLKTQKYF